jgi:hypothetical protein
MVTRATTSIDENKSSVAKAATKEEDEQVNIDTRSHLINTNRAVVAPASGWHVSVKSGAGEDASGTLTHL